MEKILEKSFERFIIGEKAEIMDAVPHEQIKRYLGQAKIFFVSSRYEGSSIAVAEAMCLGCSLVGTLLECSRYFVKEGEFGSIAKSWDASALLGASIYEVFQWLRGERDPSRIAEFFVLGLTGEP